MVVLTSCSGDGNDLSVSPPPPPVTTAPLVLETIPLSRTVRVAWKGGAPSTYRLFWSSNPQCRLERLGLCQDAGVVENAASPVDVRDLDNGKAYYFTLRATPATEDSLPLEFRAEARPDALTFDGPVEALAVDGDGTAYVAGPFRRASAVFGGGIELVGPGPYPSATTVRVGGRVDRAVVDQAGRWVIAGTFTSVGGQPRENLARVWGDGRGDGRGDGQVDDWHPQLSGSVNEIVIADDGTVYVAGAFELDGSGVAQRRVIAFDADGQRQPFNPVFALDDSNGPPAVRALAWSDGVVYLGGRFTRVDGEARTHLAAFDDRGRLLPTTVVIEAPNGDGRVDQLRVHEDLIFVRGRFSSVQGAPRFGLASLTRDGAVTEWAPRLEVEEDGRLIPSFASALEIAFDRVFVGGPFSHVDHAEHAALVSFDLEGDRRPWRPCIEDAGRDGPACRASVDALVTDGAALYFSGEFTAVDGQPRSGLAAVSSDGTLRPWSPRTSSRSARVAGARPGRVYVGGDQLIFGSGVARRGLAAIAWDGRLLPWAPEVEGDNPTCGEDPCPAELLDLAFADGRLYVAGRFDRVDGEPRSGLAAIRTDGAVDPWHPDRAGRYGALAVSGDVVYAAGQPFSPTETAPVIAVDKETAIIGPWTPRLPAGAVVTRLAVDAGTVYVGGDHRDPEDAFVAAFVGGTAGPSATPAWTLSADGRVSALVVAQGRLYVGGAMQRVGGQSRPGLAEVDDQGQLTDRAFEVGGTIRGRVHALATLNGVVHIGGRFDAFDGVAAANYVGLDAAGDVVDFGVSVEGSVSALALGGTVAFIGGRFDAVGRAVRGSFARINVNGRVLD